MTLWLVRAGTGVGAEQVALSGSLVGIGWGALGDLSGISTLDEVRDRMVTAYPDLTPCQVSNFSSQVFTFQCRIQIGDLVALPLRSTPAIAFGKITSAPRFSPEADAFVVHQRSVEWVREDVPRGDVDQDLLNSLGAFTTVCRIQRNDAENRIKALLAGAPIPAPPADGADGLASDDVNQAVNLVDVGRDQIRRRLAERYTEHALAELVGKLLEAEGFTVLVSPPGPDNGVDVLAGYGANGFGEPRIAVQVKSGSQVTTEPTLSQLIGTMSNFGASHGLMVSWSGFTSQARAAARRRFFSVRLWTSDDIIDKVIESYDRLPDSIRADIPLVNMYTLAPQDSA